MFHLRLATGEDWPGILAALRPVVEAGDTYDWPPDMSDAALRALWLEQPGWTTVVAVGGAPGRGGDILGVADFGPNRIGRGSHVANASFVVAAGAAGRGVGRALGEHVLAAATDAGFRAMQFNAVVATNVRAIALWESLGFTIVGTVPGAFAHPQLGEVALHVMHRMLGQASAAR